MMSKKTKYILIGSVLVIICVIVTIMGVNFLKIKEEKRKIKNATIIVNLVEDKKVTFANKMKVSDFIVDINGEIVEDKEVDTVTLGEKDVSFEYVNEEGIKIPYSFQIEVVDDTPPVVWLGSTYNINTNFKGSLEEKILCADDYDDEPTCKIEGEYNTGEVGSYKLTFIAEDSSGNRTEVPFTLNVSKPKSGGSSYSSSKYKFDDAKADLGGEGVSFGIDVSSWQGDINFLKVKNAGVEFAMVRVGSKWGIDKDFFLDSKFERNMKGFNEVGIPVGTYFYSYARNEEEAKQEAEWLIDYLKDYKVDLPIAFDFEDWNNYNKYKMSIYRLNRNAEAFIETVRKAGYDGMIYGSLNYLNRFWNIEDKTVWVAHYTKNANYKDKFKFWQFSAAGRVDGVPADVDLDIMYK